MLILLILINFANLITNGSSCAAAIYVKALRARAGPADQAPEEGQREGRGDRGLEGLDASALSKLNSWRLPKFIKIKWARSLLYRRRFLQVNTRWKALAKIYTMHSFAPLSNLKIFVKNRWIFCCFFPKFRKFGQLLLNFRQISPFFQNAAFFLKDLILAAKWFNFGC